MQPSQPVSAPNDRERQVLPAGELKPGAVSLVPILRSKSPTCDRGRHLSPLPGHPGSQFCPGPPPLAPCASRRRERCTLYSQTPNRTHAPEPAAPTDAVLLFFFLHLRYLGSRPAFVRTGHFFIFSSCPARHRMGYYCVTWSPLFVLDGELRGLAIQSCRALPDLPHPCRTRATRAWGGDVVRAGPECGVARSARNSFPPAAPGRGNLAAADLPLQQHHMRRALRHRPARHRLPHPLASALNVGAATLSQISYSPLRPPLPPVTKDSAKVSTVPVPLKGPSRGSATSAPKQHGVGGERRG